MTVTQLHPKGALAEASDKPEKKWIVKGVGLGTKITAIPQRKNKALVLSIEAPSPDAIPAPCSYFGSCGGCQFQEMTLESQRSAKESMVLELLQPFDGHFHGITGAPSGYKYRNKMEFSFSTQRYLPKEELLSSAETKGSFLGMHPRGWFSKVVSLEHCELVSEEMNIALQVIQNLQLGFP